ncbi:MAG: FG-GAP-like repeat-containing protein [Bacteroidetes bacterium]|nr:FG-GAP-like repeat-containing protein [Bacteroidota bacterium]
MRISLLTLLAFAASVQISFAQLPFKKVTTPFPGLGYSFAAWGDYDRDGDLDVVVCGALANDSLVTKIFRNDAGIFTDIHAVIPGFRLSSAEWGDFDNDGDLDILITGDDANNLPQTKIYRNDNGIFVDSGIPFPGIDDGQATWGDYDNDGDLDILLAGRLMAKIFRNDGSSVFTDINAPLPDVQTAIVAWGDYNNDGWLDAVVGGDTGGGMITKLFKNTAGSFKADTITLTGLGNGMAKWGDLDNDGDADLLIDGMDDYTTGTFLIYRNDGGGHFTKKDSYSFPHAYSSIDLGDYDNDGFLDIILIGQIQGCGGAALTVLYHNESVLIFTDVETYMDGFKFGSAGWGDYNNDGFADLLFTGLNQIDDPSTEIYRNASGDSLYRVNTPPLPPAGLQSETAGSTVTLKWNKATDGQTPQNGLSYNLLIGTAPDHTDILSPMSDPGTGMLLRPCPGNAGPDTSWTIHDLTNGTYYWSVQTVDNGFLGSAFAAVQSFTLTTAGTPVVQEEKLRLFPNPAKENIYVEGISAKNAHYRILGSTGETITEGTISSNAINIQNLKAGLYFIKIYQKDKSMNGRFIKK